MTDLPDKVEGDREILRAAQEQGRGATLWAYMRLSGPGWLQSAITLGGGSLASSLYLGVLAGFGMLWLQPIAMILGIIMLGAISYVTLSTGERPFKAVNEHINPVLGWSWGLASVVASMVWCMPQYSLSTSVLQQNLLPGLLGESSSLGDMGGKVLITVFIYVITTFITWGYDSGHWGLRMYEMILKLMVAGIVLCFFGVVASMASVEGFDWGAILAGFVPKLSQLYQPAPGFDELLSNVPEQYRSFWESKIVGEQRNVMISAAATAVGINMTFLFPYTLLKRGWGKEFRGLAVFDLSTGMFVPFVLATSCVIIAAGNQFHFQLGKESNVVDLKPKEIAGLERARTGNVGTEPQPLTDGEKRLAAALKPKRALDLARSLEPLTGGFTDVVFGLGVLGMTLSTISIHMLICGVVLCELFGVPATGWRFRLATLAATTGVLGPFIWTGAGFYLAIPASVFGMTLLPIAYLTFFMLMNQKNLLKEDMPTGGRRLTWNLLMAIAAGAATLASIWVIWNKTGYYGLAGAGGLLLLALIVHFIRPPRTSEEGED